MKIRKNDLNRYDGDWPIGLYVHIPFCQSKCRYCGFYSEPLVNYNPERLVSALISEFNQKRFLTPLFTIYIGGGSPSCLPEEQLLLLINQIASICPKTKEFTIEVNPGQVNDKILNKLHNVGVNRLSIGAQSFNQDELAFLGRRHTIADISRAVSLAKKAGFKNISLDLIFAIPGSSLQSWKHSITVAINSGIQHISAYALTYEEDTPMKKALESGEIEAIDEETDRQMYEKAIDELENAGFKQYEISNFAKPGFECLHNLNYWANNPYIGIGPAAGSYWNGSRTLNIADIKKYIEAIENNNNPIAESQSPDKIEIACENAVLNLRRRSGINLKEYKQRTGFNAMELFAGSISKNKKSGLIRVNKNQIYLSAKALPIADSILCDFSDI